MEIILKLRKMFFGSFIFYEFIESSKNCRCKQKLEGKIFLIFLRILVPKIIEILVKFILILFLKLSFLASELDILKLFIFVFRIIRFKLISEMINF